MPPKYFQQTALGAAALASAVLAGCHAQSQTVAVRAVPIPGTQIPMKPSLKKPLAATLAAAALLGAAATYPVYAASAKAKPIPKPALTKPAPAKSALWVTAYYPVWVQASGMPPDKIDFSAITHLVHFAIAPRPDGTIDDTVHGTSQAITPAQSADVVGRAHKAGDKALVCLGGADSGPTISAAMTPAVRPAFVRNLVAFVAERGYDGLDIDMEPILHADEPNFVLFIRELRAAMKTKNPKWLLTFPASGEPGNQPKLAMELLDCFDQINVQTYDLSGPWEGWTTWYNASLYGGGPDQLLTPTRPYPSASEKVDYYLAAGVPRAKLGLGLAFYGCVWNGASGPAQPIVGVTMNQLSYSKIMDKYDTPGAYHWDPIAHAPYLSVGAATDPARKFISFDDARLAREKVLYAKSHGLGGVIIWELGDGYRDSQPVGKKDALLQAVKRAWQSPK